MVAIIGIVKGETYVGPAQEAEVQRVAECPIIARVIVTTGLYQDQYYCLCPMLPYALLVTLRLRSLVV